MLKGIIYYTDNRLFESLFSACQKYILASGLPIVSASLKPINFGQNTVVAGAPGYPSMVKEIVITLEKSNSKYVFFCEHDVLYHKSHFDFTPSEDDVFYYNMNNWRWGYPGTKVIRYNELTSLSQLCVNRELALRHFTARLNKMKEIGFEKFDKGDPYLARKWGYEPGRRKKRDGGFLEEKFADWNSDRPNIDIRHTRSFSASKMSPSQFIRPPTGWVETTIDNITDWDLKSLLP